MPAHKELIASILKNLGHPVPSDADLTTALKAAFVEVKNAAGVNPDSVKYKLTLVPIEKRWVDQTF